MVIGIDPGTAIVGYSFVSGNKQNPIIHDYGVLTTQPEPKEFQAKRLVEIASDLEELLSQYSPSLAAVEDIYFANNQKTVISVSQARGVILYILCKHGIPVVSPTPLQIKQTICGHGKATKKQVQAMTKKIFGLEEVPKPDDAADSLAIAWWAL